MHAEFQSVNLKQNENFGDRSVDVKIIMKYILKLMDYEDFYRIYPAQNRKQWLGL